MRTAALLLMLITLTGCYSIPKTGNPAADADPASAPPREYRPKAAAALAFDPPMAAYAPLPAFSREGRNAEAFIGYEQSTVDSYHVYQRDQQRGDLDRDRFDRTSHTSRTSVTYR